MAFEEEQWIDLVDLAGIGDHDVEGGRLQVSWADLVAMMSEHDVREGKTGPCFIPARMKPTDKWQLSRDRGGRHKPTYRNDANVEAITVAVMDLDRPGALEKAQNLFGDIDFIAYSTHSFTAQAPYKYRMVMRLDEPVAAEEWPRWFRALTAGIDADRTCGNLSRVFYYPSARPDAAIAPQVLRNTGRVLCYDDIAGLEKRFGLGTGARVIASEGASPWWGDSASQRHFSGIKRNRYQVELDGVDQSYEGFVRRHQRLIDGCLRHNERHNFALRVISREFVTNGTSTDLFRLLQFLYRATEQFSNKPLYKGDTPAELPEMIESAAVKFDITTPDEQFRNACTALIARAERCAITASWNFPPPNTMKSNPLSGMVSHSYQDMRRRHYAAMKMLASNGDATAFARQVFANENQFSGEKGVNIIETVQFIYRALAGFETSRGYAGDDFLARMEQHSRDIRANDAHILEAAQYSVTRPDRAFVFALNTAQDCATGKRPWLIPETSTGEGEHAPRPSQEMSP